MDWGDKRDDRFGRSDFTFDEASDLYTCPNGKELRRFWRNFNKPRTGITKANEIKYTSRKADCAERRLVAAVGPNWAGRLPGAGGRTGA